VERRVGRGSLRLWRGDLTTLQVDAIVSAANSQLAGGGGVDGAIHRAAGPGLMGELRARHPSGCPTGSAVATAGHRLSAGHVIHAVGPRWQGGERGEPELLAMAWRSALLLAARLGCASVAAPSISTGVYGYPVARAAPIAIAAAAAALAVPTTPLRLTIIVLFSEPDLDAYRRALLAQRLPSGGAGG